MDILRDVATVLLHLIFAELLIHKFSFFVYLYVCMFFCTFHHSAQKLHRLSAECCILLGLPTLTLFQLAFVDHLHHCIAKLRRPFI